MGKRWKNISDKDTEKLRKYWINFLLSGCMIILIGLFIAYISYKNIQMGGNSQIILYIGLFILLSGFGLFLTPYFMKKALDREELKQTKLDELKRRK
jgi:hypothetical protein